MYEQFPKAMILDYYQGRLAASEAGALEDHRLALYPNGLVKKPVRPTEV